MLATLASSVKAYWWKEIPNFGDAIAPLLLKRFADIQVEWAPISHSLIASIGSVLEHIPPLWNGYIVGSGRLIENSRLHLVQMTTGVSAKILSLRGPLSARGVPGNYALGDPGILADELVGPQDKEWDLGILPHWQDKNLANNFLRLIPKTSTCLVINPQDDPLSVIRKIGSCKRIVTSSLHGMIAADSFGIPRRIEICPAMARDGGDFKFRDYSASIKMAFKAGVMAEASRFRIEDLKFNAYDTFRELKRLLQEKVRHD
jgi:pyruvyltransferase